MGGPHRACGRHCPAKTTSSDLVMDSNETCVWCERVARAIAIPAKLPMGNRSMQAGVAALRKLCHYPNATALAPSLDEKVTDETPPMFPVPPNAVCAMFLDSMEKIIAWLSEGVTLDELCHTKLDMCSD